MNNQNNNYKFEELKKCVYCESNNIIYLFSAPNRFDKSDEIFSVSRCNDCGIVFQNPRVKSQFIEEYYTDTLGYYYPGKSKDTFLNKLKLILTIKVLINHFKYFNLGNKSFLIKLISWVFKRKFKIKMIPDYVNNGKVLDIGCSHGALLQELRGYGWEVKGLEMHKKSAEYAQSLGLDVYQSTVEGIDFPDNYFNAITMGMVLEHLHEPFESLEKITKWIKPRGQLIFSIPYFNGFEFSMFKEYCYGLQLPHHIVFLNKKVIVEYLKKIGYKNIKFYFQYFDRDVVTSAGYKYSEKGGFINKILSSNKFIRFILIKPLVYILSCLNKTSRVTVYAEKC